MSTIRDVTELITEPGLVNLDFADVRAVLQDGGIAQVSLGESDAENRALEAAEEALESPLLETGVSEAKGALVNITGCPDMSLGEAESIADRISGEIGPGARITWGARISEEMRDSLRVMVMIPGVSSPYEHGLELKRREAEKKMEETMESIEGEAPEQE